MDELEQEWIQLIFEAKKAGLSIEEVREFFLNHLDEIKSGVFFE